MIQNFSDTSKQDFYGRNNLPQYKKVLNLLPSEEVTYKLDNVLPLTSPFNIIIYNNLIKIVSKFPNASNPNNCKNINRKITNFSKNSRRNLSKHLCRIRFDQYPERWFCTLTFHNVIPEGRKEFKNIIDKFNKRISRKNIGFSFVWKLEFQKRGAPHLHYLLLFTHRLSYNSRSDLAGSIKKAWIESVGDTDELFRKLSVDIRQVGNNSKTVNYLCKYINKLDDVEQEYSLGRFWAVSKNLNENPLRVIKVDEKFYDDFRAILLHYLKQKYKISEDDYRRIALNNSLEIQIHFDDSIKLLNSISNIDKLTYIKAQIQNSPP